MKWSTAVILVLITPCATAAAENKASVPCHNAAIMLEGYERNSNDIKEEGNDYMFVEKVNRSNAEMDLMPCLETEEGDGSEVVQTSDPAATDMTDTISSTGSDGDGSGVVETSDPASPTDSVVPEDIDQCVATDGSFGTSSSEEVSVRYNYKIEFTPVVTDTNVLATEVGTSILNLLISSTDLFPGCNQKRRNRTRDLHLRHGNARDLVENILEDVVGIAASSQRNVLTPSCKEGGNCSVIIEALMVIYTKLDDNRIHRRHLIESGTVIADAVSTSVQESMENGDLLKSIANENIIAIDYLPMNIAPEIASADEKLPIVASDQAATKGANGRPNAAFIALGSVTTVLLGFLVVKYRKRDIVKGEDEEHGTDEGDSIVVDESINHFVGIHQLADDSLQTEDLSRISDPQMIDDGSTLNESHSFRSEEKAFVNAWIRESGQDLQSGYRY